MGSARPSQGYSVLELMFVLGIVTTMAGITVPGVLAGLDDFKTLSAVRYVSARLQRTRIDALSQGVNAAIRFTRVGVSYSYGVYADGNGDGIKSRDIQRGIDKQIAPDERLPDQFPGVEFGTLPGLPAVDASSTAPGSDPVKFGSSDMASFTPLGTSTAGSLYVLGPRGTQYVIRVFGETGKVRILRFTARTRRWEWR
jgi:type II secretory pathway pseudopilin PulG